VRDACNDQRGAVTGVAAPRPGHLPERFGLSLIIALGESIVAIGGPAAAAKDLAGAVVVAVAAIIAMAGVGYPARRRRGVSAVSGSE
jgi:hypothetical protein